MCWISLFMREMRAAILDSTFEGYAREFLENYVVVKKVNSER